MALTTREKEERKQVREARRYFDQQIENATMLLIALHLGGFRTLFLESMLMDVSPFSAYVCIWLDDKEVGPERFDILRAIADLHNASISLGQPLGPGDPSRIRLWPSRED